MRVEIKVIPNSKVEKVIEGRPLIVRVREPPKKGRANRAAVKLLSKHFNARVRIVSGAKRRRKIIGIEEI